MALDYLRAELQHEAPTRLEPVARFDEAPLQDEGRITVFRFTARLAGPEEEPYYVLAGQTVANYYPDWGLTPDQLYSVHIGTRFMLVVEVRQLALEDLPTGIEAALGEELAGVLPGETIGDIGPVAAFRAEDQTHVVCATRIGDEDVYVMGGDLPIGIYRQVHLPPHVIYRWHLGEIIRMERDQPEPAE
jgi:hypothetical protein